MKKNSIKMLCEKKTCCFFDFLRVKSEAKTPKTPKNHDVITFSSINKIIILMFIFTYKKGYNKNQISSLHLIRCVRGRL